jgi:vanillate O-demethylase monooxygenase subunit
VSQQRGHDQRAAAPAQPEQQRQPCRQQRAAQQQDGPLVGLQRAHDGPLHRPDHDWEAFDAIVMEQDRRIVENQRPEVLPLDLSEELHLRGSDAGTLAYRRMLRDLGVAWHH